MIISMKLGAGQDQADQVCKRIDDFGFKVHSIQGTERVVIAAVGVGDVTHCLESLRACEGVESAVPISVPYKFVSKQFKPEKTEDLRRRGEHWRRGLCRDGGSLLGGNRESNHGHR